jgi:signal transduction histidine kinase
VGAVLVTAVATLAVAAVALLGPLEHSLRNAELNTLKGQVTRATPLTFKRVDIGNALFAVVPSTTRATAQLVREANLAKHQLFRQESALGVRIGASEVAILGGAAAAGKANTIVAWPDSDLASIDPFDDGAAAFRTGTPKYTFGSIAGVQYARAAIPFTTNVTGKTGPFTERWVLIVRQPLDQVNAAVAAVRTAFLYAALAALVLTLVLVIPLSGRLVRRMRRLRQAALQLSRAGPDTEIPVDRSRDEIGDLSRAFSIMRQRLWQQEQARRSFVATASHELRTPLTSLEGMLELLEDDLRGGDPDLDDARSLLARARAQSRRLGRLAADLLDLSRLDAQVALRSEPVELGELSRAVLAEFELGTAARALTPVLDDSTGPVWAWGDPGSVARILRILLENAVRVSPHGAHVTVELRNADGASLSVRDEGPGVAPEECELIFERFKRGRETGGQAGFGLGLAIGRELAHRMGGELVLDDSGGEGASFTLRLRAAHAPEGELLPV